MRRAPSGQAGFTLLETSITLVLLLVGLMIAAELLMESSQLLATTAGEAADTPVSLSVARIRADVQGAEAVIPVLTPEEELDHLVLTSRDGAGRVQQIVYTKAGDALLRQMERDGGVPDSPEIVWRNVTGWQCQVIGGLVDLEIAYLRRAVPRSPLPGLPVDRGPRMEERRDRMYLLARGSGLGASW